MRIRYAAGDEFVQEMCPCKNLWADVLKRTMLDYLYLKGLLTTETIYQHEAFQKVSSDYARALEYICSDDDDVGSFLWICDILNMPHNQTRDLIFRLDPGYNRLNEKYQGFFNMNPRNIESRFISGRDKINNQP